MRKKKDYPRLAKALGTNDILRILGRKFVGNTATEYQRMRNARERGVEIVQDSVRQLRRMWDVGLREAVGSMYVDNQHSPRPLCALSSFFRSKYNRLKKIEAVILTRLRRGGRNYVPTLSSEKEIRDGIGMDSVCFLIVSR